jgi:peroxiredoxin Q/BCP
MLKVGDRAPAFQAQTTTGVRVDLEAFQGKWLVLYFFPKAFTPGCTAEAKRFRDNQPELAALGAEVLGVSHDDLETQCHFAKSTAVGFPLVGDADRALSRAFGVGRALLPFDKRATFVIDPKGVVRAVFHHEFQISRHLDDVLNFLQRETRAAR